MEQILVRGDLKNGIPVIEAQYPAEAMRDPSISERLSKDLLDAYDIEIAKPDATTKSCIVVVKTQIAGSPFIRALYDLYRRVTSNGGELKVVDYPIDYIPSLSSLGVLGLSGFQLYGSEDEALKAG